MARSRKGLALVLGALAGGGAASWAGGFCMTEEALRPAPAAPARPGEPAPMRAVGLRSVLWRPGKTLRVRLLGGLPSVREAVQRIAPEWSRYAHLPLRFVESGPAEIRVGFRTGGSWSQLGTNAEDLPQDRATMNFGWFDQDSSETNLRRTILHEFGHALGLGHEHMSPDRAIQWNRPIVLADMARQGWSQDDVERNIFRRFSRSSTMASRFDPASIMAYEVPERWTLDGFSIPYNTELSPMDKAHVARLYPHPEGPPGPPPAPPPAAAQLALMNTAAPTGDGRSWRWTAHVHGRDLHRVRRVTYHLHPTFRPRDRVVTAEAGPTFPLTTTGWGTFRLGATAELAGGGEVELSHQLVFDADLRPPTVRPPAPPQLTLSNTARPTSRKGIWQWTAHVSGPDLDQVEAVTYLLHPTFSPNRVTRHQGAGATFPYTATGWGTFELGAQVQLRDGRTQELRHRLRFEEGLPDPSGPSRGPPDVWLSNSARPTGRRGAGGTPIWSWTAYLEGPDLARVAQVTYHLHPSFAPAHVPVDRRTSQDFALTRTGWGTFRLGATAHLVGGGTLELEHDLVFH